MSDVFLSYKREDSARVRKVVEALRRAGLDAWWDEDIPSGAQWEATIEKALAAAKAVVVCWTPASVASENVRSEARVAREDGRLVQLFLRPCAPPLFFGERQGIDLTKWRGDPADPRIARVADAVRRVAAGERVAGGERPRRQRHYDVRIASALAILLLIGSAAGWWLLSPAKAQGLPTLAVLPFHADRPGDTNLVDAIWEDTREAIGRNPNLRVLGRESVQALAAQHLAPADYRRKVGADYLLEASVEHVRNQVQLKLNLVRTKDGDQLWSDRIGGNLDDVFEFQQRIANEIEGRIRGRVAPGGGVKPQYITTTGEVYAIFAEARADRRKRDPDSIKQAGGLLEEALAEDPNYAPALAELAIATFWSGGGSDDAQAKALPLVNRALGLAPNLASAHAALALVQGLVPESEPELRRAVALDPNDAESWMWLGTMLQGQNRIKDALEAHSRAAEIEPLFPQVVANKIVDLVFLNQQRGVSEELKRVRRTGDEFLLARAEEVVAENEGRPGDEVRILLKLRSDRPDKAGNVDMLIADPLLQLGFIDEAVRVRKSDDPHVAAAYRGVPPPPAYIKDFAVRHADEFWAYNDAPALFGRLLPKHGRLQEFVGYYKAAFKMDAIRGGRNAPTVAADLRAAGEGAQADSILHRGEVGITTQLRNGPARPDLIAQLAYFRAAQGQDDRAVALLGWAVERGWLPDRSYFAVDIADEPCFARLLSRTDFQTIRKRILTRIDEERRKVPLALLARTYPLKAGA